MKKNSKKKFFYRFKRNLKYLIKDKRGGSMIESGLLIALSLILFLILIGIVVNIYDWIEIKFEEVLTYFIME